MLLDHVEVVEQPVAGGADVHLAVGGVGEGVTRLLEQLLGLAEAAEERPDVARAEPAPARRPGRDVGQPLAARQRAGVAGQALGAEQLAAEGAGTAVLAAAALAAGRTPLEEAGEDSGFFGRAEYGCHCGGPRQVSVPLF